MMSLKSDGSGHDLLGIVSSPLLVMSLKSAGSELD